MAKVVDRWHKAYPKPDEQECGEHKSKTERMVPTKEHGQGKRWQARWYDASGRQRSENFDKKADADARANGVATDLRRGKYVDPQLGRQSFASAAKQWADNAAHRDGTAARVERALRLHILPALGHRPIAAIQRSEIQAWVKNRSAVLAPSTLGVDFSYIVSVFKLAQFDGLIGANPCENVMMPEDLKPEIEPLLLEVVEALIAGAHPHFRALHLFAAGSGLRQGELFGLEVEHINFLRREVKVRQQLLYAEKDGDTRGMSYLGPPKTKQSFRTVPLAKSVVDALAAHLVDFPAQTVLIEDRTDARKPVTRPARLIFTNALGRPVRRGAWSSAWSVACSRADVLLEASGSEVRVPDDATLHSMRHFYASVLIAARESVKVVQKRLGHAKPSITLDTYSHLWPEAEDTSRDAVEALFGQGALNVPSAEPVIAKRQVKRVG